MPRKGRGPAQLLGAPRFSVKARSSLRRTVSGHVRSHFFDRPPSRWRNDHWGTTTGALAPSVGVRKGSPCDDRRRENRRPQRRPLAVP